MTININKDVGSKSNITIKGLGDPGPFSFAIIKGSLPTGTTFDQATGEIKGNFTQKGDFDVTIAAKKKDRIQGSEDFTFKVTDWTIHRTDFKNLVDNNNLSWTTTGTVTKILDDPDIFDGECYEVNGRLTINLPEAIGTRDFEIDYIFKPLNNGGSDMWGRILMVGPNNTSGMFYFCRNYNYIPATILFQHCPNGSTSYTNTFPNVSSPLINNDWNHILLVRKNGVLTYFLNGVREQENSFTLNMDRRELYIGANNSGSENFYCRVKRLQIRVYDNSHFSKSTLVTDVWRYRIKERSRYLLKSTERNNYLIECNYAGNYTTRVKEGHFLPTGLVLRSNRITGDSDLTNNLTTTIELLINGTVNDEVTINIIDIGKPYRVFELPLIGTENDTVFGDTQSRQWTRRGDVKIVKDTDNLTDATSTYFDGAGDSLYLTSNDFILGSDDFCYSFWLKPITGGGNVSSRRIFNHGANSVNGTFILFDGYGSPPNITFYIFDNGNWQNISARDDKLNDEIYNHIVLARKNNVWRLLVNGKLIFEKTYVVNLTGNTVYLASNDANSENYKGNYFDFKLSRYTLDYWDPFIPPPITRWTTAQISVTEQIGTDVRRLFKSSWPHDGVTYKVKDTSALPLGLTLEPSGLLSGTVTHEGVGETIIECYISGVLNHTTKLVYDIMVNAKSRFLTHSIKASANVTNGLTIVKSSNTINTPSVSPVMTEVGPMLSLEFKNPYTAYGSTISIPHAETQLGKKAFCMEAEIYFNGDLPVMGRQRGTTTSLQPLFCKSYNTANGEQGFYIQETNGVFGLSFNSGSSIPKPLTVAFPISFDKTKRNHIALTYDLEKLRFFVNGTLIQAVDWVEGWSINSTQPFELGQQMVMGYPGYFSAFTGFVDNFNLYQGNAIYTKDFVPELNRANLYPEFPIVEPNKPYKGSIMGINGHTVSLLTGSLPPGLSLSTDGKLTGTCTVTSGDYPVTFTVVKGTTIENISVSLTVAQYILDLNLNNAITNGTLTDNIGNVFTVNGNPTIQADSSFSSGRSIYFNGSDSYLSIPADKIFKLGKSDFVLEFEFKAVTEPLPNGGSYPGIISQRNDASSQHAFSVWLATGYSTSAADKIPYSASNKMSVGISVTTVGSVNVAGSVECSGRGLEKNKVYKVKFVRSGTTIRLYIDDRLMESVAIPANYTFFSSNQNLLIGCLDNTSITNRLFNGYLGSLRIYVPNSADLFTTGIKPETIDKYDPYYENVYALFPFESDLLDVKGNTWTIEGTPAISQEKATLGSSSAKFTGLNSSIYANSVIRNYEMFTIDFWVHILSDANGQYQHSVVGQSGNGGAQDQFISIDFNSSNSRKATLSRQSRLSVPFDMKSSLNIVDNQWNHVEFSFDGKTFRLFINGILDSILDNTLGWQDTGLPFRIGRNYNPGYPQYVTGLQGYLKYFRVTKGIVRHKTNFQPPTDVMEYRDKTIITTNRDFRSRALELQPIGYWPLDDNSGTVARDISGNEFHGNIVWGTPVFNGDRLKPGGSKSMGFLSGTTCVQVPIAQAGNLISGLAQTGKEFTIIYLYRKTSNTAQNRGIQGFDNTWSGDGALRVIFNGSLEAAGGVVNIPSLSMNDTQFVAWKKDFKAGKFKALSNGLWYESVDNINANTPGRSFSYPLMFPGSGDSSFTHYPALGYMSDVMIFNKALTDSQIEELYALLDRPPVLPDTEDIVPSNLKMALIGNSLDFEASANAMPITVNGNVSIVPNGGRDTDSLKFAAGSSLEFNYPDVINIGSKPFAVEFDVKLTSGFGSTNGTEQAPIITNITSANGLSYEWFIGIGNTYAKIYYGIRGSAYSEVTLPWPDGITLTPGVKYTIVIQRDTEGKVCCYLNGKRGTKYRLTPWGSAPVPSSDVDGLYTMNVNFGNIGKPIRVGNFLDSYQLLGELSNLKVYIGQHLYNNSTYKLPDASGRKQFRYYKMNIVSGMSSWTELQEMELATTVNGKDVTTPTTPVTAIGYYNSGAEVMKPEGLVDNNLSDPDKGAWSHSSTNYPQWVIFDLGQPLRLDEVRIMGRNKSGYYDRGPKQFEIQGSNDNSSWTLLNTLTANDTYKPLTYKRFRLVPIKYRYYKMEIFGTEGGDGYSSIGRVLYGLNNTIVTTSLNTKVTASSFYSTNPVTNLIKSDNPQNGDDAWTSSTPTLPQWIIHDFGIATEIDQIRMIPQLSPHNQRAPKFFRILGSNDGAIWDTIKDFRNVTGWTSGTWNILSLTDQDEDK